MNVVRCSALTKSYYPVRHWTLRHFLPRHCLFLKLLSRIINWNLAVSVILLCAIMDLLLCPRNLYETTLNLHAHIKTEHHYRASYVMLKRNNRICAMRVDAPKWALANSTLHTPRNVHPSQPIPFSFSFFFFASFKKRQSILRLNENLISHSEPAFW